MNLKVKTYGNVSSSFSSMVEEIVRNAAEKTGMPPVYTLHLCKDMNDYDFAMNKIIVRARSMGVPFGDPMTRTPAQTLSFFDGPETMLVEDGLMSVVKSLEDLEGVVSHEWGHAEDYWEKGKISTLLASPTVILPTYGSGEYWAERNAIEAGYLPGCLAGRVRTVDKIISSEEGHEFNDFFLNLGCMGWRSAFLHNALPAEEQKLYTTQVQYVDKLWTKLVDSRRLEQNRNLLNNEEAKSNPKLFADENLLEDWVRVRMKEYGLRNGLLLF